MTLALLDEIAAALAEAAQPTKRGRPAGKDRLGELAERAAHAVEAGNDKDQVLAIAAKIAGLDKARARHLQIMLNSLLQDRAGKERK
ncbi:hypothetical protein OOJ09_31435 [Mesorhizobium qingshengii]|uniref:Uncharacterized protein n=1 Tax=Mesorhizobium qingshengii TaxID=1165689 RepID=A0ABT4R4D4_9HYPH|nr:hypothetical protein [Mesorhizobium qingshengii]MCZ8548690.1 hypothetical protein [Mesorhizobium qingshengii]